MWAAAAKDLFEAEALLKESGCSASAREEAKSAIGKWNGKVKAALEGKSETRAALHAARTMLKVRAMAGAQDGQNLFDEDMVKLYMDFALDTKDSEIQVEALTCIVNSIFVNVKGFQAFETKLQGVGKILTLLEGGITARACQVGFRILNISFQHLHARLAAGHMRVDELEKVVSRLSEVSILTLIYMVRNPKRGGKGKLCCDKSRLEVVLEILSLQTLLAGEMGPEKMKGSEDNPGQQEMFTQMGIVLAEILLLPVDLPNILNLKARVLGLLTFMPMEYSYFLSANKVFGAICEVLERQLYFCGAQNSPISEQETRLLPALVVLSKAVEICPPAKLALSALIFPEDLDTDVDEETAPTNKMEPANVKPGSFQSYLFQLMSSPSENMARIAGEFLWTLCDGDSNVFVRRTGLGHAVGLLQMKGLLQVG